MMWNRVFPAVLLVLVALGGGPARAGADEDAAAFIDNFGHRAIDALTAPDISDEELVERFRGLFREGFDIPYIARSALGRFWPRATEEEKAQYIPLFEDYVVEVYAMQFRQYSGETFQADGVRPGPEDMVTVLSTVVRPDGPTTKVEWIVNRENGTMKIRDVRIEGVSMTTTHRDVFANEILQRGGKVAGLIEALRDKTAQIRAVGKG